MFPQVKRQNLLPTRGGEQVGRFPFGWGAKGNEGAITGTQCPVNISDNMRAGRTWVASLSSEQYEQYTAIWVKEGDWSALHFVRQHLSQHCASDWDFDQIDQSRFRS